MENALEGKVALITGGGGGLGRAAAAALVREGARVLVVDLVEEDAATTVEAVGGPNIAHAVGDVTSFDSMQEVVARAVERWGKLDIAHNNAGIDMTGPFLADVTVEQFERVIGVNLLGVFLSMKAQLPAMLKSGGGSIINMSSGLGEVGIAGQAAYVASKHGVIGLTKTAALEYSSQGVRVNAILPGLVQTPMVDAIEKEHPGFVETLTKAHPIGRLGTPEDIANAVVWLGSDASSFVAGASIAVDGGFLAQ